MTDTEPTVDLGAVRWSTENRSDGWHFVAIEDQPDGYGEVVYDLLVERATDTNGADLSGAVAEALAQQVDGWIFEIDRTERDAYARGFDAGERSANQGAAVAATIRKEQSHDRDAELRWDLGCALGWDLPENPADGMTETPTWAEIINGVKALRELSAVLVGSRRVPCICGEDECTGTATLSKSHDDPEAA